jgi:crotonobetainyl-CoA:carnitine CoA-transferase CaiB-like acyl-CoA transferase
MFTAEQYRAKAAEYCGLLDTPRSPNETKEFRNLEQTYATMADNEEWLARNTDKVVPAARSASEYDIVPASQTDRNKRAILVDEHEHVLRCLGAAIMMRWSTLPTKLQRELFDHASSLDDFDRDDSISDLEQTAKLKERIARFLHHHNGKQIH